MTRSTPCSAASPGGSGLRDARQVRRQRALAEAEVPHPDLAASPHAQEIAFNDIRTTLQAPLALNDNCNSLHTNAYDGDHHAHRREREGRWRFSW
ncbi:MAG: methylmalonyl-CoA mutase family protein [Polyangiales bacterium]